MEGESTVVAFLREHLPALSVLGLQVWQWVYAVLLSAVAWGIAELVRLALRTQVERLLHRIGIPLDPVTWRPTNGPLVWLVLVGIVRAGLPDLSLPPPFDDLGLRTLEIAGSLLGVVAATRFVMAGAAAARTWAATTESKLDDQAIPLLTQGARLVVFVLGGLYVAQALGLDVWKLAAGVGVGGLALALAAQDTVANLFGSINIFFDKPFQIGDWVRLDGVEGIVEEVGFRSTRLRTAQNSLVTVPNSRITSSNVDNHGLRDHRRVKMVLGLTYDATPDQLVAFTADIRGLLTKDPVVTDVAVHVSELAESSINVTVGYQIVGDREAEVREQHVLTILRLAAAHGLGFAFPTRTVHLVNPG